MERLKILISGAGVAGLTCAALFEKEGIESTVIEKSNKEVFNSSGYMLGLLPLGGRVLNQLDLRKEYISSSIMMDKYEIYDNKEELIKSYSLKSINEKYGYYGGISRITLINLLLSKINRDNVKYNKTIKNLDYSNNNVTVNFNDDESENYDLVVITEGMHSETRKKILSENEYNYYETGWGGWVTWLEERPSSSYKEFWGDGVFVGLYPVKNKVGAFLGGPIETIKKKGEANFINETESFVLDKEDLVYSVLDSLRKVENPFFWNFHDCRSKTWYKGNVILLGDSATGFLPTAGVGASMAMDSAAALVDEISRVDKDHINYGLKLFTNRQKNRVEMAQKDSRNLGKFMFIKSSFITNLRDKILSFYSLEKMLNDITRVLEGE